MRYKIIHPESDSEFIAENPKEEDLDLWLSQGCLIEEIKEIKKALLIGTSKLISLPNQIHHLWHCRACQGLFNAKQTDMFKIIECPLCREKIHLGDITKNEG